MVEGFGKLAMLGEIGDEHDSDAVLDRY